MFSNYALNLYILEDWAYCFNLQFTTSEAPLSMLADWIWWMDRHVKETAFLSDLENYWVLRDQEGYAQEFCTGGLGERVIYFGIHFGKIWISCREKSSLVSAKYVFTFLLMSM